MIRVAPGARLALRMPNWLGDFVLAEPLVNAAWDHARRHGGALTLVGPRRFLALFERRFEGAARAPVSSAADERAALRGHDAVILLNGGVRSAWSAVRAGVPARIGLQRGANSFLLNGGAVPARERGRAGIGRGRKGRFPRWLPRPFETTCQELGAWAGIPVARRRPLLVPTHEAVDDMEERMQENGLELGAPYLLLNAAGRSGSAKAWPPARWLELVRRLQGGPLPLVVLSAPGEDEVARHLAAKPVEGVVPLVSPAPDLPELLVWIARARALVTVDSGPRHLATATGAPTVVLYGSTDPRHTADWLREETALVADVACTPCHRERCRMMGDDRLACLDGFAPDAVERAVRERAGLPPRDDPSTASPEPGGGR